MVLSERAVEIACALIEGSCGYYIPSAALLEAEAYLRGERRSGSERCLSLYGGDLARMVEADLRLWRSLPRERRERARAYLLRMRDAGPLEQLVGSLLCRAGGPA